MKDFYPRQMYFCPTKRTKALILTEKTLQKKKSCTISQIVQDFFKIYLHFHVYDALLFIIGTI